ncbi:LAFE_0G04654g1_1 [Lachancea fermentati]|uniref:LAFE_0G04654g1_1 n=1 Tax=Lachancea fermentati TaxID=4955 RepID=A0A1G4MGZ0_LACFM|nr:LAFE_0G04654g1_1 [Lachancea fermentati]
MASEELLIDETTYYSILGLTADATEAQIKKAYRKIAVVIHPDKNKSEGAAELFKVVSHAQSVLTDETKRRDYNRKLIAKNLHNYVPRQSKVATLNGKTNSTFGCKVQEVSESKATEKCSSVNQKPRKSKPYEQQPYGFGVDEHVKEPQSSQSSRGSNSKPFKAKSYQHQRPSSAIQDDSKKSSTYSTRFTSHHEDSGNDEDQETVQIPSNETQRKKMAKKGELDEKTMSGQPASPFLNSYHRHYTRTMHHDKQQSRRSVSPVKSKPTSSRDSLEDVKNIMKQFAAESNSSPSTGKFPQDHKTGMEAEERIENSATAFAQRVTPTKTRDNKLPTKQERQEELESPNSSTRKKPNLRGPTVEISPLNQSAHKNGGSDFTLDELNKYLPKDDELFDMRNVSDTLDNVRIKRFKAAKEDTPEIDMVEEAKRDVSFLYPQPTENLSRPVNETLPRIYKPDMVSESELGLDSSILALQLPPLPVLHFNILQKTEVERIKEEVKRFNVKANEIKRRLIDVLLKRSTADELFNDRLTRVENANLFVQAKSYDVEVATIINELQNRQRIVAESFSNLMKSIYASGGI